MSKNTALIIIDVQEDMFSNPHYPLYKGNELLHNVGSLLDKARSANVPVIYIQHTENDDQPMGKGKHGWYIHHQIAPLKDDTVILKYTPDSFHDTNLHDYLSSRDIGEIVIAGLQTDYCIDTTCRRAFSLGYKTVLVQDAHSTFDSNTLSAEQIIEHHNGILGSWFAKLVPAEQISFK